MFFNKSRKKTGKQLAQLCRQADTFIQVHYVRERNDERHKYNFLSLKDDPDRAALIEWLEAHGNPETFNEVCQLFLSRASAEEDTICERAHLERGYFSKLKNPTFRPTKCEAVSICFAMKLNLEETRALLKSADYALSNSAKSDLVIRYFIENENYHIDDLNYVLEQLCETTFASIL